MSDNDKFSHFGRSNILHQFALLQRDPDNVVPALHKYTPYRQAYNCTCSFISYNKVVYPNSTSNLWWMCRQRTLHIKNRSKWATDTNTKAFNTFRPEQYGWYLANSISKCMFLVLLYFIPHFSILHWDSNIDASKYYLLKQSYTLNVLVILMTLCFECSSEEFLFKKMCLEGDMPCLPFCLSLNMLKHWVADKMAIIFRRYFQMHFL